MKLALFDLDHTLLAADSTETWVAFLAEKGLIDASALKELYLPFERDYQQGKLNMEAYVSFSLKHLIKPLEHKGLQELLREYVIYAILPHISKKAFDLLAEHRAQGHTLVIVTATFEILSGTIARALGVDDIIATRVKYLSDGLIGEELTDIPCYQLGKIQRVQNWIAATGKTASEIWFYSDSHNDIPLLEWAHHPIVVNPSPKLLEYGLEHHWPRRDLY